jgi:DNA-binding response OmpR family regulator
MPMRILIVEDSPLVQKMYGLAFSHRQHTLVTAANGRLALSILDSDDGNFDLILLDLRMPDMNGVEFLTELPRHRSGHVPVVLTTAEPPDSPMVQQARSLGTAAVVHKPWRPNELRDLVKLVVPEEIV